MTTTRTRLASLAVLAPVAMVLLGGTALAETPAQPAFPPFQIAIPAPQPIGPQDLAPAPQPTKPAPKDLAPAPQPTKPAGPKDLAPAPKPVGPQGPKDMAPAPVEPSDTAISGPARGCAAA